MIKENDTGLSELLKSAASVCSLESQRLRLPSLTVSILANFVTSGGGGGGKLDEFQPHPVKEQLPGVDYCVTSSPSWPEGIILGFQHYLVVLGSILILSTILVPLIGGGNVEKAETIQTLLFVAAINTLLQTWFGTRLPVVVGASYAFLIPAFSVAFSSRMSIFLDPHQRFKQSMRAIQGALIVASFFQIIVGFFGFWRIFARFLSPLSVVPLVTLTGLGLFVLGFPRLADCVEIGLPALVILVILSQYIPQRMKSRGADRFAVIVAIGLAWAFAEILTAAGAYNKRSPKTQFSCRTDRSGIRVPYPFQWGRPSFNAGDTFAMIAASLVAIVESTGTFIAASRFGSATPVPPSVLSRGVGWLGISTLLDGFFGTGIGSTASVENAGLLGLTRVGSRRVIQISAGFMLFFSILGKFGAVLASIPLPIIAAIYCVLYAYVASAGLGFLQFCNLNSYRSMFIVGFSLFMGLSVPQYFNEYVLLSGHGPVHTGTTAFNNIVQVIFSSPATVAIIVAYFLDLTMSRGEGSTRRDTEGIRVGFLHCLAALGTIVMASSTPVPLMGGDNEEKAQVIETLLFVAAINTLLQTWFGTRLPVVVGASYTFLIPATSVAVFKRMIVFENSHQYIPQCLKMKSRGVDRFAIIISIGIAWALAEILTAASAYKKRSSITQSRKFGAFLASIPLSMVAAIYCVLFSFVASSGLGYLQFCNINSYRSMFILGVSPGIGLFVPKYFNEHGPVHTGSTWFNNIVQALFSSPASVAIIVAYFLDLTVSRGERSTCRDSGRHWCQKFRTFNQDSRTEDFSIHSLQTWADISPHIECTSILI
ncbi:Nucleobase-ascorbate transporter 4 [Glycine soja]